MNSAAVDAFIAWIAAHPVLAGVAVFLIAFSDAIVVLGVLVPLTPIFFAVGALIGLGSIDGVYAISAAAAGAFCGDGLSFWFGHHYGEHLKRMWPFSRHPEWLENGERFFWRHGIKGIVIARYVGAVRPFVPAIAGMLRMPLRHYAPSSAFASLTWAAVFIAPGWVFGASIELFQAVAGRLAVVLGILIGVLLIIYFVINASYRFFAPRAAGLMERTLAWSHRHPVLGRFSESLIDPNRPESASLLMLALLLLSAAWGLTWLLANVVGHGDPLALDLAVHHGMFALRTPLADHWMAILTSLGDWQVFGPPALLAFLWLLWRRRRIAAWHWLAAIAFGIALVEVLGNTLSIPKPPVALKVEGFSFPSEAVTFATVVYGFFAVLIARELPGRKRAWPYVVAATLVTLVAFSRVYFGAHWLSDVLAGLALGLVWISILGLAYRRRMTRSFWIKPISALFFGVLLIAGIWHGSANADAVLARFATPVQQTLMPRKDWWRTGWRTLPARRNDFSSARAWPMNVQFAGKLRELQKALEEEGWKREPSARWTAALHTLDSDASAATLPLLAAAHEGRADIMVMSCQTPSSDERIVLRLWSSPLRLGADGPKVWQGSAMTVKLAQAWQLLNYWAVGDDTSVATAAVADSTSGFRHRRVTRFDAGGINVLLVEAKKL